MNRKKYNLLIENWRHFLNENKINKKIDDDELREFLSAVYSLVDCISNDEIDEIQYYTKPLEVMGVNQNDIDNLIKYVRTLSEDEKYDLVESGYGYVIKKSVFQNLGFTQADIDTLINYDSGLNDDSSYDYYSGVSVMYEPEYDSIRFTTEY